MHEKESHQNIPIEGEIDHEVIANFGVPIIDIVRHGETDYKELSDKEFTFSPDSEGFELDEKHLDLNKDGIRNILETAKQLEGQIDKENEVILVVTSPNFRAHSSALLIEKYLRDQGVNIINEPGQIQELKNLGQMKLKGKDFLPDWVREDKVYRQESPENAKKAPEIAHKEIAARLGLTLDDIFAESHDDLDVRFNRFLRHMTNVYDYLGPETKESLRGKKLRIICLTHEEIPRQFIEETLQSEDTLMKSQIMEIRPDRTLRSGGESEAEVVLFPKGDSDQIKKINIKRKFKPNK